ncbi:HAD-IA family hydrolase [Flavobacteriaceae bacterium F89]|uniref:HAD-IA family hydrolase n=1 Tax=Cerina litoralis TaxID=2874477 RepID=A0AAE3EY42_9FLAO|nr:HAD-IA family hydrolase [Cerina litoralis]MCG2461721.1 HAD-IA family hydrolase [Cerina litoralis]
MSIFTTVERIPGNSLKYKCVIFDCDGVLVDSEVLGSQVFVDFANEYGANIDLEYAMKHFKGSFLYASMQHVEGIIGKPLPNDFENRYRQKTREVFKEKLQPVAGVKAVLQRLDLPICTASSGPREKIVSNLANTGLSEFFGDAIFSCYDLGKWKPDPAIFLFAAKSMGFAPSECVVIEDSIFGALAAQRGGFDVFGYTAHEKSPDFIVKCTAVFDNMEQLVPMIMRENG